MKPHVLTPPVVVHQNPNVEVHELQSIETNNPKDFVTRGSEGPEFEIDRILQALSNDQKPNDVKGKYIYRSWNMAWPFILWYHFYPILSVDLHQQLLLLADTSKVSTPTGD